MDPVTTETTWVSKLLKIAVEKREIASQKSEKKNFHRNGWHSFFQMARFSGIACARGQNCDNSQEQSKMNELSLRPVRKKGY